MNFNNLVDLIKRRFRFYISQWSLTAIYSTEDLSKVIFITECAEDKLSLLLLAKRTLSDYPDISIEVYSADERKAKDLRGLVLYTRYGGFND